MNGPPVFQASTEKECLFYVSKFVPLLEFVHNFSQRRQFPLQVRQSMQRPVNYRIGKVVNEGQFMSVIEVTNVAPAAKKFRVQHAKKYKITCADDVHHLNLVAKILNLLVKHRCIIRLVDTFMTVEHYYIVRYLFSLFGAHLCSVFRASISSKSPPLFSSCFSGF